MYLMLKVIVGIGIVLCTTKIGIMLSQKYVFRLEELDEFKNLFTIVENKIKYTYEPLEEIFNSISTISSKELSIFFKKVAKTIKDKGTENAWNNEIEQLSISIKKEDKEVLKEFGRLLGKTNKEGQINQIKFVITLLERQIEKAKLEREKNEVVYKKLGLILGMVLVIILI